MNRTHPFIGLLIGTLWLSHVSVSQTIDTVRVGSPSISIAKLQSGTVTIRSFKVHDGVRTPISTTVQTIKEVQRGSRETIEILSRHVSVGSTDTTVGIITVRKSDLALLRHKVKAQSDSSVVTWSDAHLTGWSVLPDQPVQTFDLLRRAPVFPVEGPAPWFIALFPLKEHYSARYIAFSMWSAREEWKELTVLRSETLDHHGVEKHCWVVDCGPLGPPGYRVYRWVEKTSGRILQGQLKGPEGQTEYWGYAEES